MIRANSYKIKDEFLKNNHIKSSHSGGTWINKNCVSVISKTFFYNELEFSVDIGFPDNLRQWNDFDYILVMDEDFGQPYTPFYGEWYKKEVENFPCLEYVIQKYNEFLDSLDFLEKV